MLALRLPPDIEERLEALARRTGRSKSFYAREAILEHLGDLEVGRGTGELGHRRGPTCRSRPVDEVLDHAGETEVHAVVGVVDQRLADLRAGRSGTVPLDELMRRHGLDD